MKIKFLGAAREVTGSKYLIVTDRGKRILLDCGMFQGKGLETDSMNRDLGFEPDTIDHIILTHAHIDHSGLIPYVYRLGFRGSVICTTATRDLCAIMLADSGYIQENDTHTYNKRRAKKGLPLVTPIYTREDATACMSLFIGIPYNMNFRIDENIKVRFTSTGHMLGSGVANLQIIENGQIKRIAFTGDIGRPGDRMLVPPEPFPQADIIITESTYGDRLHEDPKSAEDELLKILIDTCVTKRGKLIIPAFSVGRTQEIIYDLNNFFNEGKLPRVNIYVDSPLAVNATEVFRVHTEYFNEEFRHLLHRDDDLFGFRNLFYIKRAEDSKKLNDYREPCVIISASGMMEAGRVKHHLANSISESRNTVLAVGYCAPETLGARILRGSPEVSIHGTVYKVKADIRKIDSFSGHADYREMIKFLSCQEKHGIEKLFLVHGDYEVQRFYAGELQKEGFRNIEIPARGEEYDVL
ncbi:MAG TPA: MBL fold metallo-hydrolase [Bacteroidales bacterium]|nr:MBL fold metallo-hydrolase [Bacteroidales bacterium]HPF02399.1 MBL fold metallo-hydrolase [Bacteroidales bacterium]HRW84807.1 MBL fold metallo-hydrolase [Bacteroidales bacterium]